MKYAMLIYDGPEWETISEAERQLAYKEYFEIADLPEVLEGEELAAPDTATTVTQRETQTLTTDGPFPDTKEAIGGYFIVDVPDLDGALELAARIPTVRYGGAVEVRPVVDN